MKAFVYEMKNTANGKVYIGVTCNLEQRIKSWLSTLKSSKIRTPNLEHIKRDFRKYSSNIVDIIEFGILAVCEDDIMFVIESKHILKAKESGSIIYNINYGPEAISAKLERHKRQLAYLKGSIKKIKKIKKLKTTKLNPTSLQLDRPQVYHFLDYPTIGIGYSEKDAAYYVNMQVPNKKKLTFFQGNIETREEAIKIKRQVEVDFGLRSNI